MPWCCFFPVYHLVVSLHEALFVVGIETYVITQSKKEDKMRRTYSLYTIITILIPFPPKPKYTGSIHKPISKPLPSQPSSFNLLLHRRYQPYFFSFLHLLRLRTTILIIITDSSSAPLILLCSYTTATIFHAKKVSNVSMTTRKYW